MRLLSILVLLVLGGCFGASDLTQGDPSGPGAATGPTLPPGHPGLPDEVDPCLDATVDPGRVTIHRLNRAEYNNTVRDLLGDSSAPAQDFPADDHGYGFDNNADVLSLAPLLMEKYEAAAEKLVEEAWARDFKPGQTVRLEAEAPSVQKSTGAQSGSAWNLYTNGSVSQVVEFEASGAFTLSARAWGSRAGTDLPRMEFRIDGVTVAGFDVDALSSSPKVYSKVVQVQKGARTFAVHFTNDFYDPNNPDPALRDRNLYVDWFEAKLDGMWAGAASRVRVCDPAVAGEAACFKQIVETFARRAYRRPAEGSEVDRLMGFLTLAKSKGDGFEVGVKLALQAVLLSPHFLFRIELDEDPTSAQPRRLTDHELASRLSYFLWSSMPDDTLLDAAAAGALQDPDTVALHVDRMLKDPRAHSLVANFAGQWLETRAVDEVQPSAVFGPFTDALRADLKAETEQFFRTFLEEDRPLRDMLDADFTFLNDRLADHYGLPRPGSETLTRVSLPEGGFRGGILTQGAFLTITSHADRTSPVKRGQWVLAHLLCKAPPPPPPEVENLTETAVTGKTLRERMEQHRADPSCSGCHAVMDPIGFGLENYDAVGKWRTTDEGHPIDATGELPGGLTFDGPTELAEIIKADPNFSACVARNLMMFGLGRGYSEKDFCAVREVAEAFDARGGRLSDLVHVLAQSELFTMRRGEAVAAAGVTP
jgi:hypothetical protein